MTPRRVTARKLQRGMLIEYKSAHSNEKAVLVERADDTQLGTDRVVVWLANSEMFGPVTLYLSQNRRVLVLREQS